MLIIQMCLGQIFSQMLSSLLCVSTCISQFLFGAQIDLNRSIKHAANIKQLLSWPCAAFLMLLRKAHCAPSPTLLFILSQLTLSPHYIDWERCGIGYVDHKHIDHIDPPCEPWENVELQISYYQQHTSNLPLNMRLCGERACILFSANAYGILLRVHCFCAHGSLKPFI